jgi:cytosine/adenosine deaminase-related metal-dependent hydrolase
MPLSMHWSETEADLAWLRDGSGPLAALLGESPRASGLDLLEQSGMLRAPLSLVHGNFPARGEAERIAAAGAVVVHCPGSHAWFERAPFPLRHYRARGVVLALGTDSLASNDDLDMRREMARLRSGHPELAPAFVWEMATRNAATALGARGFVGELQPGACADLVAFEIRARSRADALEQLTASVPEVAHVWIGGRALDPSRTRRARAQGAG